MTIQALRAQYAYEDVESTSIQLIEQPQYEANNGNGNNRINMAIITSVSAKIQVCMKALEATMPWPNQPFFF